MELELLPLILLILIGIGAGFVQRVSGFGLSIFAMIFLPYLMATTEAVTLATILSLSATIVNVASYYKKVLYKTALPMVASALVFITIAVRFSTRVPEDIFKMLLGIVLIALSIYFLFFNKNVKLKPTVLNGLITGAFSGTLGGLFSTSGPPAVLYVSSAISDNIVYFATIQFYFCLTNVYSLSARIVSGIVEWTILPYAVVGIAGCMVGNYIGKRVFDKLDAMKLKTVIYIGMIISGIVMLV
jgi:uncharacterized membrane protein YfcA